MMLSAKNKQTNVPCLLRLCAMMAGVAIMMMTGSSNNKSNNNNNSFLFCQAQTTATAASTSSAATFLANDVRFSKFLQLLDRAGISPSTIAGTIFAPTTDAFNVWRDQDVNVWNKYVSQPEFFGHLREILLWHLVTAQEGAYTTSEIFNGSREKMENSVGNITIDQRFQKVDNVPLTAFQEANLTTSDGIVIHVLDQVIIPPYMAVNLIEHMLERDTSDMFTYSTMANLALYVGLDEKINSMNYEHGITFLVPPNRRFNRAQINVPALLTPEMKDYTRDFVLCHLITDMVYYEAGVFAYNNENDWEQFLVITELGTHMWITTTGGRLRFQSREVILTDRVALNGIFHVLDLPVYPPFISDFTEFTAVSTNWDTGDCNRFFVQALLTSEEISQQFNSSLTVFCPSREAFAQFNNEDFQRLLEPIWVRHATEFLMNHITIPALTREELVNMAPTEITMLNGLTYELKRSGDRPRIKNTEIEQARSDFGDLIALDGYLHMLDTAITPTAVSRSIYDQSNENPNFSLLVENIDFVQLTDLVDRDSPLTLLAPDNTAFRRVVFGTLDGADIIKRHIFKGLMFCDVIANQTEIETVEQEMIAVELRGKPGSGLWGLNPDGGQNLYVGGAYLYNCDMYARNGILHYIDRVIGLDYDTVSPTISPAPTITPRPTVYIEPTMAPVDIPTGFSPIALPPVLPGVVPSAKTDDSAPAGDGGGGNNAGSAAARTTMTGMGLSLSLFMTTMMMMVAGVLGVADGAAWI